MRAGRFNRRAIHFTVCALLGASASSVLGQTGRPAPASPQPARADDVPPAAPQNGRPQAEPPARNGVGDGNPSQYRRPAPEGKVILAFDNVPVEETIPFVVETTGKVVMPVKLNTLRAQTITLINDNPIPRSQALDLLFAAFRLNDIGVVEREDRIIIGSITDIVSTGIEMPVLGPDDDVMYRQDLGNFVVKVFRLERATAEAIGEQLEEKLPDYASLTVDTNSNQIVVTGDIGLLQHLQRLINELDKTFIKVKTKTYRLKYADASEIADNILELFEEDASQASAARSARTTAARRTARTRAATAQTTQTTGQPGPIAELRLTVNTQQNTVTMQADPNVIDEVDRLIYEFWDLPRPEGTSKLYVLRYSDPIKVRDMLQELLQGGSGARTTTTRGGGAGGRTGVDEAISGVYKMEAFPDSNSLLVLSKTEETFSFLDSIVDSIDQPTTVGLPIIIELKHAQAVSLADEMNVLLSEAGSSMTLARPDAGLSAEGMTGGDSGGSGSSTGGAAATGRGTEEGGEIRFPWQSGRQREDQSPETPLIGKTRIVPIIRQNALAVLAPPQYQEHVREIIQYLDRPGRQVMISAILAEVELNDDFALGVRVSREGIPLTNIDNSVGGSILGSGTENDFLDSIFDVSTLDVDFNANFVIQALAQETNVRILQEPRVFTADNQEAVFFDGQDVPFVTDSFTNNVGGLTQGFEYRQVGVVLNVRPRITAERDVDMEIYLELSSIVPGQTLFGGAIVDRRSTTTQIVVKNSQTIVLSGILRDTENEIERKVPLLGDIPLVGELFKSRETAKVTAELVAFITPTVVNNPDENDVNFNADERSRLQQLLQPMSEYRDDRREQWRQRIIDMPEGAPNLLDDEPQVLNEPGSGSGLD
ncbi:MAG: secretin N-terminal domain-containing protein [Planctomycetota bacterium]